MRYRYDVLVAGDYCLDLIFTGLNQPPELGVEIVGSGFEMVPGGTYNTTISLHRLGVKVGWATDFGSDPFSLTVLNSVNAEGTDTSLFVHHAYPLRRITVAASYPHERALISYYDPDPSIPAVMKAITKTTAKILYLPGIYHGSLFDAGMILIKARRMRLVMDGNSGESSVLSDPKVKKSVQNVQCFMPNSREARRLTGETDLEKAICVLGELCPLVVVKDGPNGAFARLDGQTLHSPAIPITPLDTTGAGDAFNAGFIKAWLQKLPIQNCLDWGNIVGGLSTLGFGGTGKIIREQDVLEWSKKLSE